MILAEGFGDLADWGIAFILVMIAHVIAFSLAMIFRWYDKKKKPEKKPTMNAGRIKSGESFKYKGKVYRRAAPGEWAAMKKSLNIQVAPVAGEPGLFMLGHQNCICVIGGDHRDVYFLNCEEEVEDKPKRPQDCCEGGKYIVSYSMGYDPEEKTDREWDECQLCGNRWPIVAMPTKIEERT